MLESMHSPGELNYQKLSLEEQASRGILGRLLGPIADFKNATRNGRKYRESLWEKVFDNPIIKEKLNNRCLFGELGHPTDREEVDMEKIAICLAEAPKKGSDGKLHGVFDILDTPNGRILKTLCDYGCNIGVSSRGTGDIITDYETDEEVVDEDTYECECFDAVILPAVKDARLKLVTESLESSKTLKQALAESINASSEDDKRIMQETLDSLNIDYKEKSTNETEVVETVEVEDEVADNDGTDLVDSLQEALKENSSLQQEIITLNEKLSVSYTKEVKLQEELEKAKVVVKKLNESVKQKVDLNSQIQTLSEQVESLSDKLAQRERMIESFKSRLSSSNQSSRNLSESVSSSKVMIESLKSKVSELEEENNECSEKMRAMTDEISTLKMESKAMSSQYAKKLNTSNKVVESYKNKFNEATDRYIQCKATMLGISASEVKGKLNENYSFDDIDRICESMRTYNLNMNNLPFRLGGKSINKISLKEDSSTKRFTNPDDEVDKDLLELV